MRRVLAIAAHPDDIEFLMSGTLLNLQKQGYEVHYLNLANGNCGSTESSREQTTSIRLAEAKAAAELLGAVFYEPICNDLEIFYEQSLLKKVAAILRVASPDIVLTHSPTDYMEDHTNTCRLAVTAAFVRGMPNFSPSPPCPPFYGHVCIYHAQPYGHRCPLGELVAPEILVDTTDVIDQKSALLAAHSSQKLWLDQSQGLDSYLESMRQLDREAGSWSSKFTYAEGWRRHSPLGFGPPKWDPLAECLGEKCQRLRYRPS